MFLHLVESDSHKREFKRRGAFFMMTLAAYALFFGLAGVAGVYAYEARIDDHQYLELVMMVPPEIEEQRPKDTPRVTPNARDNQSSTSNSRQPTGGLIKNTPDPNISTDLTKTSGEAKASTTQPLPILSEGNGRTFDPGSSPFGTDKGNGKGGNNASDSNEAGTGSNILKDEPPAEVKRPEKKEKTVVSLGVVTGRALYLPQLVYPAVAKAAKIQGVVTVEILIDETGRVAAAHATNGNPLLRPEAERAAYKARFSPTLLSEQPVKAKGIITFNFTLR